MARPTQAGFQEARKRAGLSQSQAAAIVCVPTGTLQRWELTDSAPRSAYELLLLKAGLFRLQKWQPAKGDERSELLLDIGEKKPLSILMDQEAFDDFAATLQKAHYGGAGGGKKK